MSGEDLIFASLHGDLPRVIQLLDQNINVNSDDNVQKKTALMIASMRGHLEVVKVFSA